MLTLAFTALLAKGALLPVHTSLFAGASAEVPRASRLTRDAPLLATGVLLAQAEAASPAPPPPPGQAADPVKTVAELRAEYQRLSDERPSIGGPIAMLAIGVVLDVVGLVFGVYGLAAIVGGALGGSYVSGLTALAYVGIAFAAVAFVALAVGIPFTIIGAVRMGKTFKARHDVGNRMEEIDNQIREIEQGPAGAPPPPPSATSVERNRGPTPTLLVAEF